MGILGMFSVSFVSLSGLSALCDLRRPLGFVTRKVRRGAKEKLESYMTGGTLMPMTASTRMSSRRTTAAVANRKFFRPPSASVRIG
jgi:hypothetical protein